MEGRLVLKGNILYTPNLGELVALPCSYLLIEEGLVVGTCESLPAEWLSANCKDYGNSLLLPGLTDLHIHAPQYTFRGLGLDMELLSWLETYAFPEEARYADNNYALAAYTLFTQHLQHSFTCRANIFATIHNSANAILAKSLALSGLIINLGKVSMDRNCPEDLNEGAKALTAATDWVLELKDLYPNVTPIITPRFIPSCGEKLQAGLGLLAKRHGLPVQSHLSENLQEIEWVRQLEPQSRHYADAYDRYGLLDGHPTVMAHCVHLSNAEQSLLKERGVFIAHCPQSNINLISGAAPIRAYLQAGLKVGLATDMGAGAHISMFRVIQDTLTASKLRTALVDKHEAPLSVLEAFYLASKGGGAFFGKAGSLEEGYAADILVIDDTSLSPANLSLNKRLERVIYTADGRNLKAKYVEGNEIKL